MQINDNYDLYRRHEREQEDKLKNLPRCEICGEPIQEEFYYLPFERIVCKRCIDDSITYVEE